MARLSLIAACAALLVPWCRPFVEWALPVFGLRTLLAVLIGMAVMRLAHVLIRNAIVLVVLLTALAALKFFILPRILKTKPRPQLAAGAVQWLKYTIPNIAIVGAFDVFLIAYYAFVRREGAALLLAGAALVFAASQQPALGRMFSRPGALPARSAIPALLGACAAGTALAAIPLFHHAVTHSICAALFVLALVRLVLLVNQPGETPDHGPRVFNARLLVFLCMGFVILRGGMGLFAPGGGSFKGLQTLANPGTVYDVLPLDDGRSVVFSLKMPGRLGRVDTSSGAVTWSPDRKKRVLMRMAYLKKFDGIVVTTSHGLPLFNARTLALERFVTRESFDYLAATAQGDRIYTTIEPVPQVTLSDPRRGVMRRLVYGVPFLFWPYDVECAPDGRVFISNWITSPMFVTLSAHESMRPIRRKVHGFFNAGMALDPAGNRIFLARTFFGRVDVLAMDTLQVVDRIPSLFGIRELAYAPEFNLLFAPSFFTGDVQVIDLSRRRYSVPFNAGRQVRSTVWEPNRRTLYMGTEKGLVFMDRNSLKQVLRDQELHQDRAVSF